MAYDFLYFVNYFYLSRKGQKISKSMTMLLKKGIFHRLQLSVLTDGPTTFFDSSFVIK